MNYLLICFSCTLSVYFPIPTLARSLEIENDRPIDDFIDKLLKSDKFDVLANKIAEKAAERLLKIQNTNAINVESGTPKSEAVYRVGKNETKKIKETKQRKETEKANSEDSNHIRDEITSLFDKNSPFNELSLKYVKLIETNRKKESIRSKTKDKKIEGRTTTESEKTDKAKKSKNGKKETDTHVKKGKGKLKISKKVMKPKRSQQTTMPTTKVTKDDISNEKRFKEDSFESFELSDIKTTDLPESDEVRFTRIGSDFEETTMNEGEKMQTKTTRSHLTDKNGNTNLTDVKTKRILGRENERYYVFASSSDYEDLYVEDLFK